MPEKTNWIDRLKTAVRTHERERGPLSVPTVERYDVGDPIGEGASGVVYRAIDRTLGRPVAFKLLRESLGPEVHGAVLAMGDVEYLSSAGIAALARLQADLGDQGIVLRIAGARPFIVRLMDMVGLHPLIPQDRTLADALTALTCDSPASP